MPRITCILMFTGLAIAGAILAAPLGAQPGKRPNIVFILMDDLRFDELGCTGHPFVKTPNIDRLASEGAVFRNAFATTPLCSPSRAAFMTGLYVHTNRIFDNVDRSPQSHSMITWPRLLHDAGYETGFVGKWHMGVDASPRPGFDHWVGVPGQGKYLDPELNIDGRLTQAKGYVTDIFNEHAVKTLTRSAVGNALRGVPPGTDGSADRSLARRERVAAQPPGEGLRGTADGKRPFCLFLAHKCVHPDLEQRADGSISDPNAATFLPAERHKSMYAGDKPPRRPNAFQPPLDKPALSRKIEGVPPLSRETATDDETIRNRLRLLMAAEEGVGQILDALKQSGHLDDTIIIFTSDHGYFYGEHCLSVERRLAYEETIRIPLIVRYPPLIKPGTKFDQFVLSIDLAPTLLELGGARLPEKMHGRSVVPLLSQARSASEGRTASTAYTPRRSFLIEYFSDKVFPRVQNMGYQAVRSDRWKYIHYVDLADADELYDLASDPYELKNLFGDPAQRDTVATMQTELRRLIAETP